MLRTYCRAQRRWSLMIRLLFVWIRAFRSSFRKSTRQPVEASRHHRQSELRCYYFNYTAMAHSSTESNPPAVVCTYQAASGAGARAMQELRESTRASRDDRPYAHTVLPHPYACNRFSHNTKIDPATGDNEEEAKVIDETRKIFADRTFRVTATCVRVPVLRAHCVALNFECAAPITPAAVHDILAAALGVKIVDAIAENYFPKPEYASGEDAILVGRVRQDVSDPSGRSIETFVAGDQLLKCAGLNAVQIAEYLLAHRHAIAA
jgi:aspartate-semialdehyde dehydrogenase